MISAPSADKPVEAVFPLILAKSGEDVTIAAIRGGKGLHRKLMELGLRTGTTVNIMQKHGGRMILAHDGQRTALGTGMTQKIQVRLSEVCLPEVRLPENHKNQETR